MRVHFLHWHVHDTVVILEEGNLPLPRCPQCDLRVPRRALNGRHPGTAQCRAGAETPAPADAEAPAESDSGSEEGMEGEESLGASGSSGVRSSDTSGEC